MSTKSFPLTLEELRRVADEYGTPFHIYDEQGIHD